MQSPPMPPGAASPTSSTLLRQPLLRDSLERVVVRTSRARPSSVKAEAHQPAPPSLFSLPKELGVVLVVDFLNSYRSFGFRSVQYQYLVNEFGLSDVETGSLLGVQAWLLVIFGMVGAMLVDTLGVRRTALAALAVASVSRAMLTFGQSNSTLKFALLALSPFGEAVLSTGIYTVALKKLTTARTRGLAFGVQYGVFNLAGAIADLVADFVRRRDFAVPPWVPAWLWTGEVFSGLRLHVFGTLLAVVAALVVCALWLHDCVLVRPRGGDTAVTRPSHGGYTAVTGPLQGRYRVVTVTRPLHGRCRAAAGGGAHLLRDALHALRHGERHVRLRAFRRRGGQGPEAGPPQPRGRCEAVARRPALEVARPRPRPHPRRPVRTLEGRRVPVKDATRRLRGEGCEVGVELAPRPVGGPLPPATAA